MQVRVQVAKLTLAVAPIAARLQPEAVAYTHWMPQAGDAGMSLSHCDREIFKPTEPEAMMDVADELRRRRRPETRAGATLQLS
jgi:uncharacterized protein DUF2019